LTFRLQVIPVEGGQVLAEERIDGVVLNISYQ
jgi:hypothetical protein